MSYLGNLLLRRSYLDVASPRELVGINRCDIRSIKLLNIRRYRLAWLLAGTKPAIQVICISELTRVKLTSFYCTNMPEVSAPSALALIVAASLANNYEASVPYYLHTLRVEYR